MNPINRLSEKIYETLSGRGFLFPGFISVRRSIKILDLSGNTEESIKQYYVKKISLLILVLIIGAFFGIILKVKTVSSERIFENLINRMDFRDEDETEIKAKTAKGEYVYKIGIKEREMTKSEVSESFLNFQSNLSKLILGKNESLEEVCYDLELSEEYEGYPFLCDWESENGEVISKEGKVSLSDEKFCVPLTVTVLYGEFEEKITVNAITKQVAFTEDERLKRQIGESLNEVIDGSRYDEEIRLPGKVLNEDIEWKENRKDLSLLIFLLCPIVAVSVFFLSDKDLNEKVIKRREEYVNVYPDVISKIVLYLGAGMSVRACVEKLADDYGNKKSAMRDELLFTIREIKSGVSEENAYEHLGMRLMTREYVRLCGLLVQNTKKGNAEAGRRLREELENARNARLNLAKKRGEEASTKLLVPMVLLLTVVMVILLVPAFSSIV